MESATSNRHDQREGPRVTGNSWLHMLKLFKLLESTILSQALDLKLVGARDHRPHEFYLHQNNKDHS